MPMPMHRKEQGIDTNFVNWHTPADNPSFPRCMTLRRPANIHNSGAAFGSFS